MPETLKGLSSEKLNKYSGLLPTGPPTSAKKIEIVLTYLYSTCILHRVYS